MTPINANIACEQCKDAIDIIPYPEDTVVVVKLFHVSNFTNLELDFSGGNSKSWSSQKY